MVTRASRIYLMQVSPIKHYSLDDIMTLNYYAGGSRVTVKVELYRGK